MTDRDVRVRAQAGSEGAPLVLDGRESFVDLLGVYVDDKPLSPSDYDLSKNAEDTRMTISPSKVPAGSFTLGVVTRFKPQDNLELSGLYKSSGNFQLEAEGFARITYFPTIARTSCPPSPPRSARIRPSIPSYYPTVTSSRGATSPGGGT